MAAGCGGMLFRGAQGPVHCHAEPTMAGLLFSSQGRTVWLAFACDRHGDDLIARRSLLPRDRHVLNRRRDTRRTELAGHRWAGAQEGPLARGAAADRLIERANAWAAAHPDLSVARAPGV
jgi:hypothetical protein